MSRNSLRLDMPEMKALIAGEEIELKDFKKSTSLWSQLNVPVSSSNPHHSTEPPKACFSGWKGLAMNYNGTIVDDDMIEMT